MALPLKKIMLPTLVSVLFFFATIQNLCAQSSLHDSLRNKLVYFSKNTKDDKLIQAIKEIQANYKTDLIDDSLSKKLLAVDGLLIENRSKLDKKNVLSYAETLVQIVQQLPPGGEHPDYTKSIFILGDLYYYTAEYEKALLLYQQALAIIKKTVGEERPEYAAGLNDMARSYGRMGQYDKALLLYQQSLALYKKTAGEEKPIYTVILTNLAFLYQRMGQYEKALPLYQRVITINIKILGEEHLDYAFGLYNMAGLYQEMGQYEKALPLYQQVMEIRKKASDYDGPLHDLGLLYKKMGEYKKALPLYQQSLDRTKKTLGEEHPYYATALNDLAVLFEVMGENEKALPLYEQAVAIDKKALGEEHPFYATMLFNLAYLYQKMGQYNKTLPLFEQALAIYKNKLGEQHPSYANTLKNLGLLYTILNNDSVASYLLTEAAKITLNHLSQTYTTLSEQEKMILLNNQSNQFSILPSLLLTQHVAPSLVLKQLYADELVLKGMILQDQQQVMNAIRKSGDSAALQLFEQWRLNKTLIGKQLLLPVTGRLPYLDSLKEMTTLLEQQLSQQAASFRNLQHSQNITAVEISGWLLKGEAAVEFMRFKLYNKKWTDSTIYAALVLLPGDSIARFVPLFEEKQLQRLLKPTASAKDMYAQYASIAKLYGEAKPATPGLQQSLYQLLWKPLEKHLIGIHTVYYAPAGLLHRIAFQALRPDATHLLIDKFRLKQVLSTRSVALPAVTTQEKSSVGMWGNINYNIYNPSSANSTASKPAPSIAEADTTSSSFNFYASDTRGMRGGNWGSLPGGKKEIDTLATLFNHAGVAITIDSGTIATEEAFKALSGKSLKVLHLATHGFFLPIVEKKPKPGDDAGGSTFTMQQNPMFRSGLVLAGGSHAWKGEPAIPGREDGILTAYEIAQMDLSSTELVVLSACETALGDLQGNEGVIGLQRAFKLAGVKQLVMSLWRVPDQQTNELMTLFYRNRISGQATREALRNAQLKMKEKYPPYYWAAFVLVE